MKTVPIMSVLFAVAIVVVGACGPGRRSTPTPTTPPTPVSAPTAGADPADQYLSLGERLAREAGARPAGAIPAETVAAALAAAGVPLGPIHQVLGRTIGARYCALVRTPAGVVVSICEFASDDEAARGLALSQRTFDRLISGRHLARNRGTVLTLTSGAPDGTRDAQVQRAAAAFAAI